MLIIGCDFHTRFQQIAMVDTTTGELVKRQLEHGTGEPERFYAALPTPARVGIEARCLLVEAAQTAARLDPELRRDYQRLKFRRGHSGVAKVAIARKLAVRLYWKLREAAQPNIAARMQGSPAVDVAGE